MHLESIGGRSGKNKDKTEKLLKKRNRKDAKRDRVEAQDEPDNGELDEGEATKRKRLALYGL